MTVVKVFPFILFLHITIFPLNSGYTIHDSREVMGYQDGNLGYLDYLTSEMLPKIQGLEIKK